MNMHAGRVRGEKFPIAALDKPQEPETEEEKAKKFFPRGHVRNPIPPVPLPDDDWAVKLSKRFNNYRIPGQG